MSSPTGGVKPMPIESRLARERERLLGMTDAERAWRRQWLKDQVLAPNEPCHVPEYERELNNPIRRMYRYPLDTIFKALEPVMGQQSARTARYITGKALLGLAGMYCVIYYFKYNCNDWTRKGGWRVIESRRSVLPGEAEFPKQSERTNPSDYASCGFKNSPIC